MVNNTDGSIVGYKYFNFDATNGREKGQLLLNLIPEGFNGTITILLDRPWVSQGGYILGFADLSADMPREAVELAVDMPNLGKFSGKHALYFTFHGQGSAQLASFTSDEVKEQSLCTLLDFRFK